MPQSSPYAGPEPASSRQIQAIIAALRELYPQARYALNFTTPLELLIATILAAQCTDERVNAVTAQLFARYRSANDYAQADQTELEQYVNNCGLEKSLLYLIEVRASQINGCAYCLDMHTKDALAAGDREQRLYLLSAWREALFYSERERAALEWTEAVTLVADNHSRSVS